MKYIFSLVMVSFLWGCGSEGTGFVSSDIPGLAEALARPALKNAQRQTCTDTGYTAGTKITKQATSVSGLVNTRIDFAIQC